VQRLFINNNDVIVLYFPQAKKAPTSHLTAQRTPGATFLYDDMLLSISQSSPPFSSR